MDFILFFLFLEGIFVDELEHESSDYLPKNNQNLKDASVNDQSDLNFQDIIYDHEPKPSDHPSTGPENGLDDQKKQDYPENYRTCLDLLQFFWDAVSVGR